MYRLRDLLLPRREILKEVGIQPGFHVLDYGCGPGSYIIPLIQMVGKSGKIYALDRNPLAILRVQKIASQKRLKHVEIILSDFKTGLPDHSIDAVLLYDTFHDLEDPMEVLKELHRVLKPNGILSLSDHHMREDEIIFRIVKGGLFTLSRKGERTILFQKCGKSSKLY